MEAVADEDGGFEVGHAERIERLLHDLRLGADAAVKRCAGNDVEVPLNFEHMEDFLNENGGFRGGDSDFPSGIPKRCQKLGHAVKEDVFLPADNAEALTVGLDRLFRLRIVHLIAAAELVVQRRADEVLERGEIGFRDAHFIERVLNGLGDALARVSQCAVEVEKDILVHGNLPFRLKNRG